jgi:hypothetical protein
MSSFGGSHAGGVTQTPSTISLGGSHGAVIGTHVPFSALVPDGHCFGVTVTPPPPVVTSEFWVVVVMAVVGGVVVVDGMVLDVFSAGPTNIVASKPTRKNAATAVVMSRGIDLRLPRSRGRVVCVGAG